MQSFVIISSINKLKSLTFVEEHIHSTTGFMNIDLPLKTIKNKFILLFIVLLFSLNTWQLAAQEPDTIIRIKDPERLLRKIDARKITDGGFNFWQDNFSGHWAGIDLGFNTFLNPDYSGYENDFMKNDVLRSNSLYVNLIQQNIGLQRNRNTIGLVTGIGLHLQSYRLDKNTTIRLNENGRVEPQILYFDQNQKSKLSIVSLIAPLLAEFQIPINHYENRLYFSAGPYAAVRLSSHTKIKYRVDRKEKLKIPGHYSLQDFKYGIMVRTGYRWINFFAAYELAPLFIENKGPELTPFTAGFTLLGF